MAYSWPGNVRQLRNVVENMVVLAGGTTLTPRDLPPEINPRVAAGPGHNIDSLVGISIEQAEKELIRNTLENDRRQPRAGGPHSGHRRAHAVS